MTSGAVEQSMFAQVRLFPFPAQALPGAHMSLTARVVSGLALGLAAGAAINASRHPTLLTLASWIEPVGTLWVNAILMTVIPLVVSSLILGVASTDDPRLIGQLGGRAFLLFLLLVCASSGITALVAPSLLRWLPIDTATATSFCVPALQRLRRTQCRSRRPLASGLSGSCPRIR